MTEGSAWPNAIGHVFDGLPDPATPTPVQSSLRAILGRMWPTTLREEDELAVDARDDRRGGAWNDGASDASGPSVLRDRVGALGGRFDLERPGTGTRLVAILPLLASRGGE